MSTSKKNNSKEFNADLANHSLSPLWEKLSSLVPSEPEALAEPYHWPYKTLRPLLSTACDLITAQEAERRVLIFENPSLNSSARISDTLYSGLQVVLPGEIAPLHRHSQGALRCVLEGAGAYTIVNEQRTYLERGDFIINPSWAWHEHGNSSNEPIVWLDGLDLPIVNSLCASFFQAKPNELPSHKSTIDATPNSDATNIAVRRPRTSNRIINYKYSRTRATLSFMADSVQIDDWEGHVVRYLDPVYGGWALPTMAAQLQLLPAGFETKPLRSTASRVFAVIEGSGTTRIGNFEASWEENDVIVAPAWQKVQHLASKKAVLFEFSDRAAQEGLELYREERLN